MQASEKLYRAVEECIKVLACLEVLEECITLLNKMYIPTRYPDAWAAPSAPYENYTRSDAGAAIDCASRVYRVAWRCIRGACEDTGEEDTRVA